MSSLKAQIIGTWKLVAWTYKDEHGKDVNYFGKESKGILMYDIHGYMNAQLMKENRVPFVSDSINGGTPEETHRAFHSYLAYFGRYYEETPGAITHIVEGSLFPNWVGNREVRYGKIAGDRLILSTPPIPAGNALIVFNIEWERASDSTRLF